MIILVSRKALLLGIGMKKHTVSSARFFILILTKSALGKHNTPVFFLSHDSPRVRGVPHHEAALCHVSNLANDGPLF